MSQVRPPHPWIDALSGMISPTGGECAYLADAVSKWACSRWPAAAQAIPSPADAVQQTYQVLNQVASDLRELTGHDESVIARCLTSASGEELLQWSTVLCRRYHRAATTAASTSSSSSASDPLGGRCLTAIGSDHGPHVVGRMLSGSADLRDSVWPLVPGFLHVPVDSLHQRIDETVAMVLLAPLQRHNMLCPVTAESLQAIRAACDQHGACLVIDHRNFPPRGGGHFWIHDSIDEITADAVLMSAGLTGGESGGVLILNQALAEMVAAERDTDPALQPSDYVAQLVASTLRQWSDHSWQSIIIDEFATSLAERLAGHDCVRDLHVTGRSIGIELDLPATEWMQVAAEHSLRVSTAGEFAIALQPPLLLDSTDESELLDRIDLVFDTIEAAEQTSDSETSDHPPTAPREAVAVGPAASEVDSEGEDFATEEFAAVPSGAGEQARADDDSAALEASDEEASDERASDERASDEENESHQLDADEFDDDDQFVGEVNEDEDEDETDEYEDEDEDEDEDTEDETDDDELERTPNE